MYHQRGAVGVSGGAWSDNWQVTRSTKCVHLLKRLYEVGAAVMPTEAPTQGAAGTLDPRPTVALDQGVAGAGQAAPAGPSTIEEDFDAVRRLSCRIRVFGCTIAHCVPWLYQQTADSINVFFDIESDI